MPTLHMASVYALLSEFPRAEQVSVAHLTRLKTLPADTSRGHYGRNMAMEIRAAARCSVGSKMPAKSLELQHTIRLIRELDAEIEEIEVSIQSIVDELHSPITTIPGIGYRMDAMILAEVGDFSRFDSADKLLAYAGMSPSTYRQDSLKTAILTWKNAAHAICAMLSTTLPSTSAIGSLHSLLTLPRNGLKGSITT